MTMSVSCRPTWTAIALIALVGLLETTAAAQRRGGGRGGDGAGGGRSGGERVGTAVPRGGGGSGAGDSGGRPSGGGSGRSTPATGETTTSTGGSDGSTRSGGDGSARGRSREDRPVVGRAEPRDRSDRGGSGTTILVPGGYYGGFGPWGYGGFGFGSYYGDWYDPWYGGYAGAYGYEGDIAGALRLKVKPREAQVFVDGYYAGIVDEFDGVFQRLRVEPGPHRIELTADGFEPLMFEVLALPDQTTTYTGTLNRRP